MLSPLGTDVALAAPFTTDDMTGGTPTAVMLADNLAGAGVTVSNVVYTGAEVAAGTFAGGTGIIDFDSGIVLSSGDIANIIGPNTADGTSVSNNTPGDADLNLLTTSTTLDAAVLEFDFVPNANKVFFSYVFGSEEYNEFVGSTFNDVFGFFVTAAGSATKTNCATVADGPDADTNPDPVTINSINNGDPFGTLPNSNPALYRNNDPNDPAATIATSMDGLTVTLVCEANVVAGQSNHLELAIADTSDRALDSYVLLKTASLSTSQSGIVITTTASANITLGAGQLTDTATVTGRTNPLAGATVSFRLYGPDNATCTGAPVFESLNVPLPVADGPVISAAFTPTAPGVYRWVASYSGDANNVAVSGACNDANEAVGVAPPPPTVLSIDPPMGPTIGGTPTTITGTNFIGCTAATFDGAAGTVFTVVSATTITVNTPSGALGPADVVVVCPSGNGSLPAGFAYVASVILPETGAQSTMILLFGALFMLAGLVATRASRRPLGVHGSR